MRNASLYNTLKEYCKATIAILNEKLAEKRDLPFKIKDKYEFNEDGGYSYTQVPEITWHILIYEIEQKQKNTDIYTKSVQALSDDSHIAKHLNTLVGTHESRMRVDVDTSLRALLTKLLQEQQDVTFNDNVFDRVYNEFESYFYRDKTEYRLISPLNNFKAESERIELGSGLSIIKIPNEERSEMLSSSREFGAFPPYRITPFNEYAFELLLEVPKVFGESIPVPETGSIPSQTAQTKFYEACSALRLFKKGAVNHEYINVDATSWELHSVRSTIGSVGWHQSIGALYNLSQEEIQEFINFWHFFQKTRKKTLRRIDVALRRFNFAYERARTEDKLIDYIIGFEALLLLGRERQELEYRLALRGSTLLSKTPPERETIFKELKTAYRERSNIVRGGIIKGIIKIDTNEVKFNEFVDRIGELLCLTIKELLNLTKSRNESAIIDELDGRIIRGQ